MIMMIFIASIFLILTALILIRAFFYSTPTHLNNTTTIDADIEKFKANFLTQETNLQTQLKKNQIDQTQFEERLVLLSRDLLEQTRNITINNKQSKKLSAPLYIFLILFFLCIPTGVMGFYFFERYTENIAKFDHNKQVLTPILNDWIIHLTSKNISPNASMAELDPPKTIMDNYYHALFVLQNNQAKYSFKNFYEVSLLANLYIQTEIQDLYGLAQETYEKALIIKPNDLETLSLLAQIDLSLNNNKLSPKGNFYFERLLTLAPTDQNVLMNYALALFNSGDLAKSLKIWEKLANQYPKGSDIHQTITKTINKIKMQLDTAPLISKNHSMTTDTDSDNPKEVILDNKEINTTNSDKTSTELDADRIISVTIQLDTPVNRLQYPNAKLYLYARMPGQKGPPILAKQLPLPEQFPLILHLSNADKMMTQTPNIENLDDIQIEAKISLEGSAMPAPTDLRSPFKVVGKNITTLNLTLTSTSQ